MTKLFLFLWPACAAATGCTTAPQSTAGATAAPTADSIPFTGPDERGDAIPDFSRVGYLWGDREIPELPVAAELEAPADGSDATELIQRALDALPSGRALLLRSGVYRVAGTIRLHTSGTVLRGEGSGHTVVVAAGTVQRPLIVMGPDAPRRLDRTRSAAVTDDYTPVGRMYLTVDRPECFRPGDAVVIFRPGTAQWIADLRMDRIPPRPDGNPVAQWTPEAYDLYWERTVTEVSGRCVRLDNPVVMALDRRYGGGELIACRRERISGCGVERMELISHYASEEDERHGWTAVEIRAAEHSWVRDVTSRHFGFGLVDLADGAKNITVERCVCHTPKSPIRGGRRYSFYFSGGELCLVRDCATDGARHGYSSSVRVGGPDVFLRCSSLRAHDDCGPHQRWATGILYDNVTTDHLLRVQDRSWMGTGQGWAGANNVLWNCEAQTIVCQSPWVSARNYAIGCIGAKSEGPFTGRPDGVWRSPGRHVEPQSLYERQLAGRRARGEAAVPASWCDRHAEGRPCPAVPHGSDAGPASRGRQEIPERTRIPDFAPGALPPPTKCK